VNLLLDTHVLLWWLADDSSLQSAARDAIRDESNIVHVSAATAWEISIKKALGKLDAPDDLANALEVNNFRSLEITVAHATKAGALPRHHDDPFDRLLIAQAQTEQLTLVTHDAKFRAYEISVIWT
jgi:PIN domain nuclease of toxin-antitoxin system